MTAEEIRFFRKELLPFYEAVLAQFSRDAEETRKQMAPYQTQSKLGKIGGFLRGIGNAIAQIIFINAVTDNPTGSEFDYNPDRFRSGNRQLDARMQILNFKKKSLEKLVKYYTAIEKMCREDRNITRLADGLWITEDICDNRSHSNLIFAIMYVFKCGLCTRDRFARICVLEDLQRLPQEMRVSSEGIKRYRLAFSAGSYAASVFEKYRQTFGKGYAGSAGEN